MLVIEKKDELEEEIYKKLDDGFNKLAEENGLNCNYTPFFFVANENDKFIGVIKGHSYYKEVHIGDLIILEEYRHKNIGTKLVETVENYFKDKEFENINLTTYDFEAPEFYKKCGFEIEFIRKNKENSKLNKYFLVKYLK